MRAFVGQFDYLSLEVFGLGAAIGALWLVALDLGVMLAGLTLAVGSVALIIRHRWIEIALLMIGIGTVVQVGYWIVGVPPEPPVVLAPDGSANGTIAAEVFAPGMAALILVGGVILGIVIGVWDMWEGRRRERIDARHRRRRARQMVDSQEG